MRLPLTFGCLRKMWYILDQQARSLTDIRAALGENVSFAAWSPIPYFLFLVLVFPQGDGWG